MTYSTNGYLTLAQMKVNAQYIWDYLRPLGWTKNAVSGMLGNMQTESSINPGIWQGLDEGNMSGGFGLVQWTPATNFTDWADSHSLVWEEMDSQLLRILYEVENELQWIDADMSFEEFTHSTESAYDLGLLFLAKYERPADPDQPARGTQAAAWYSFLDGTGGGGGVTLPPSTDTDLKTNTIHLLLADALNGWKW